MSNNADELHSMRCPSCQKRLKFPSRILGREIACPKCQAQVKLELPPVADDDIFLEDSPSMIESSGNVIKQPLTDSKPRSLEFDDLDELRLAPQEPAPKKKPTQASPSISSIADIDLAGIDLGNVFAPTQTANESLHQPDSSGDAKSQSKLPSTSKTSQRTEFRFPCKVCGTHLYADLKEVGDLTRCPDCYTQFSIPSPPLGWNKPRYPGASTPDATPGIQLKKAENREPKNPATTSKSAETLLAKAAAEISSDKEEAREETYDFDTAGWAFRTFSFLTDPSAVIIGIVSGLLLGGAFVASQFIGDAASERAEPSTKESIRATAMLLALVLLATPVFAATLANGIAILEAAANELRRIARWPIFNIGETLGELTVVAAAFILAILPGGLLRWIGEGIGLNEQISMFVLAVIAWFTFPVFLLSMLDNQSISEPISKHVYQSLKSKADDWAGMYITTAISIAVIYALYLLQGSESISIRFLLGFAIPLMSFFIFHQIGILAARIAIETEEDSHFEETESNEQVG